MTRLRPMTTLRAVVAALIAALFLVAPVTPAAAETP